MAKKYSVLCGCNQCNNSTTGELLTRFKNLHGKHVTTEELNSLLQDMSSEVVYGNHENCLLANINLKLEKFIIKQENADVVGIKNIQIDAALIRKISIALKKNKFDVAHIDNATLEGIADNYTDEELAELGISSDADLGRLNKKSVYEVVNDMLIDELENGNLPWRKEWQGTYHGDEMGIFFNFRTKKPYKGINPWIIGIKMKPHHGQFFLTRKQIEGAGGKINKGATKFTIVFNGKAVKEVVTDPTPEHPNGEILSQYIRFLKSYDVYNLADTDLTKWKEWVPKPKPEAEKIEACETIYPYYPNKPSLKHGGDEAYYSPKTDHVQMPKITDFKKQQFYYSTLFHELIHSTGHSKRLKRGNDTRVRNGRKEDKQAYAFEELVAEVGASYLCSFTGILFYTKKNTGAYLRSWIKHLITEAKDNKTFFFRAASESQKAANYILSKQLKELKKQKKKATPKDAMLPEKKINKKQQPVKHVKNSDNESEIHAKVDQFLDHLKQYAVKNTGLNAPYHIAVKWVKALSEKAYTNTKIYTQLINWINDGGTLKLTELLKHVNYKDSKLSDFNAMSLLDSVHAIKPVKSIPVKSKQKDTAPVVKPDKTKKASVSQAIKDVLSLKKYSRYKQMLVQMLYSDFKDNELVEIDSLGKMKASMYESTENDLLVNEDGWYMPTANGANLITAIDGRLKTLHAKKQGNDMFPELAGVPNTTKSVSKSPQNVIKKRGNGILSAIHETFPETTVLEIPAKDIATISGTEANPFKKMSELKSGGTFKLKGAIGLLLGNLGLIDCSASIKGDQGAGKSQLLWQLADAFSDADKMVAVVSNEIAGQSETISKYRDKYLSPTNKEKVLFTDADLTVKDLNALASNYDVLIVDSFNNLKDYEQTQFKWLCKQLPNKIIIGIFQSTTTGEMRGGNRPEFDAFINIEVVKVDDTFKNNYAVCTKNRFGATGIKYNISTQQIIVPAEASLKPLASAETKTKTKGSKNTSTSNSESGVVGQGENSK